MEERMLGKKTYLGSSSRNDEKFLLYHDGGKKSANKPKVEMCLDTIGKFAIPNLFGVS